MEIESLLKLGLNKNEAIIYLTLLEIGESQAGILSKKTQINRTTIYDTLERLIEKGLVKYSISANRKVFKPIDPKTILEQLKEKTEIANKILPSLIKLHKGSKKKEDSNVYKGKKGIKSIFEDVLSHKEYVAFGSSGKIFETMKHDFVIFQKKKKMLKIKSRVIESESARKNREFKKVSYAEFRYLPDEFAIPITIIIYGNNVAVIAWGEIPMASVITSEEVANSFRKHFNLLWKIAKK